MPDPKITTIDDATVAAITSDFEGKEGSEGGGEPLLDKMNVVGVGVGTKIKGGEDTGEPAVKILVSQKLPLADLTQDDMIPSRVGRYETDVEEVGEIFAGVDDLDGGGHPLESGELHTFVDEEAGIQLLRTRVRPAKGGYSVGHYRITAGTIATGVYDRRYFPGIPPRYYILSNNHVLANSNNARIGDPILQPGPYDGGRYPADVIGRLSRFVPIRFDRRCNYVDAAIAETQFHLIDRQVYWIGYARAYRRSWPTIGETLEKTGRTTNYTTGAVTAINATVNVNYGGGRVARFCRQIVTRGMSAGGDSGSLVLDLNENAIGLLFAGSGTTTIINHIVYVQNLLGILVSEKAV